MKYVAVWLCSWFILFPQPILAQNKEPDPTQPTFQQIIQKQEMGSRVRLRLKTGEKLTGYLSFLQPEGANQFEVIHKGKARQIIYNDVKTIQTGLTTREKIRRGFLAPLKVAQLVAEDTLMVAAIPILVPVLIIALRAGNKKTGYTLPTVKEPETTNLLPDLKATLVIEGDGGTIDRLELPTFQKGTARVGDNSIYIASLSGPDTSGWVAFVSGDWNKRHALQVCQIGGTNGIEIFSGEGDALWDHPVEGLALAPSGGKIAITRRSDQHQLGKVEVWDIPTKSVQHLDIVSTTSGLTWFPDGKRLVYTSLIPTQAISQNWFEIFEKKLGVNLTESKKQKQIPVIQAVDLETQTRSILGAGHHPVVSSDGRQLIITDDTGNPILIDILTQTGRRLRIPGFLSTIGFVGSKHLLFFGLNSAGTPPRWTTNNSPLVGPKPMLSIKMVDLSTGQFRTIVTYHDLRDRVSAGIIQR